MRWRIEGEVRSGKGQFECGNKRCSEKEDLTSWEVNLQKQLWFSFFNAIPSNCDDTSDLCVLPPKLFLLVLLFGLFH